MQMSLKNKSKTDKHVGCIFFVLRKISQLTFSYIKTTRDPPEDKGSLGSPSSREHYLKAFVLDYSHKAEGSTWVQCLSEQCLCEAGSSWF